MRIDAGSIGIWLLVLSAVVIVLEGAIAGVWTARIARRSRMLNERLASERAAVQADVERLRLALAETRELWRPYATILRWLQHPLVMALLQSYARRRTAAR